MNDKLSFWYMKYHNKKALNLCKEMKRYEGSHIAIRMHLFFDNI